MRKVFVMRCGVQGDLAVAATLLSVTLVTLIDLFYSHGLSFMERKHMDVVLTFLLFWLPSL